MIIEINNPRTLSQQNVSGERADADFRAEIGGDDMAGTHQLTNGAYTRVPTNKGMRSRPLRTGDIHPATQLYCTLVVEQSK